MTEFTILPEYLFHLVIWLLFGNAYNLAETSAAGRIQGDNFTAADWERVVKDSGPMDFAKTDGSV